MTSVHGGRSQAQHPFGVAVRDAFTVAIEHSLYGITIFTIGLGRFFYHDA